MKHYHFHYTYIQLNFQYKISTCYLFKASLFVLHSILPCKQEQTVGFIIICITKSILSHNKSKKKIQYTFYTN